MRIGTCSWKYDSWKGLIYPDFGEFNYLEEYAKHYNTVEIDQWFWSLNKDRVILPKPSVVEEYNQATPADFKFTIKMPNSLTLTHPYKNTVANPHFLSPELMKAFLHSISPIMDKVGVLMFQFEYLNKQKMNTLSEFLGKLNDFLQQIDSSIPIGIEIRNPNFLKPEYFSFLNENNVAHVFLQGYYMPNIAEVFAEFGNLLTKAKVIRLHGPDRKGIETLAQKKWNQIYQPKDDELPKIIEMLKRLVAVDSNLYLNVNNHYEGSAPLTIDKIKNAMM